MLSEEIPRTKGFFNQIEYAANNINVRADRQQRNKNCIIKDDDSPVTRYDKELENRIFSLAKEWLGADVLCIGEESLGSTVSESQWLTYFDSERYIVIVDPIDGTENFISGLPEWGVSVSVYKSGEHINSMIYLPALNQKLIHSDSSYYSHLMIEDSRIIGFSSSVTPETLLTLSGIINKNPEAQVRIMGCSVYNLYNFATGVYSGYYTSKPVSAWDVIAGLNIILALQPKSNIKVNGEKYIGQILNPFNKYHLELSK